MGDTSFRFLPVKEPPRNIRQAFALGLSDAVGVLCVEAHFTVLIDHLRMERENHVLLERHFAVRADGRTLNHRRPDRMTGEVTEGKAVFGEGLRYSPMNIAGQLPSSHQLSCRL